MFFFFFSSRRRHTRLVSDWSSDVCSSDLADASLRTLPSRYGTAVEEMADFYSFARTMMYDPAITNVFRFSTADQQRYGNNAFGNACVTRSEERRVGKECRYRWST